MQRLQAVTTAPVVVVVVLNACPARGRDADEAAEALAGRGVTVAPVRIGQRIVLARSLLAGQVAQEQEPDGPAAQEVVGVHAFILRTLERSEHSNTIRGQHEHRQHLRSSTPGPRARPTAASRQGRRHVGAYVTPDVARQLLLTPAPGYQGRAMVIGSTGERARRIERSSGCTVRSLTPTAAATLRTVAKRCATQQQERGCTVGLMVAGPHPPPGALRGGARW